MVSLFVAVTVLNCTTVQSISANEYGQKQVQETTTCSKPVGRLYLRKSFIKQIRDKLDVNKNEICAIEMEEGVLTVLGSCEQIARKL